MLGQGWSEDGPDFKTEEAFSEDEVLTTAETKTHNGHGGPSSETILDLYNKVSDKEDEDQEILLNLIENSKDSPKEKVLYVTKQPSKMPFKKKQKLKKHVSKIIALDLQKRRLKRKKFIDKITERRKPSHMQLYWEKRLERSQKNVLNESLFRDEIKRTTPPPSRKGGGEQYKPTTSPPSIHLGKLQGNSLGSHQGPHQNLHLASPQYKHRHYNRLSKGDKNMHHRQHSRISNTDIILYKHHEQTENSNYATCMLSYLATLMVLILTFPSNEKINYFRKNFILSCVN